VNRVRKEVKDHQAPEEPREKKVLLAAHYPQKIHVVLRRQML
jgi:hypothetical protein